MKDDVFTFAAVLDKEYINDDAIVYLFTRELGLVTAKVKSARKITSKLNSHLEPLFISAVRMVAKERGIRFQIVDALKERQCSRSALSAFHLLKKIAPEGEPHLALWDSIYKGSVTAGSVLRAMGFDPAYAKCSICGKKSDLRFSVDDLAYFCSKC